LFRSTPEERWRPLRSWRPQLRALTLAAEGRAVHLEMLHGRLSLAAEAGAIDAAAHAPCCYPPPDARHPRSSRKAALPCRREPRARCMLELCSRRNPKQSFRLSGASTFLSQHRRRAGPAV
ncbi:jg25796, partial [Pararge aegeria aegeria]